MKPILGMRCFLALLAFVMGCNLQAQGQTVADGDYVLALKYDDKWVALGATYSKGNYSLNAVPIDVRDGVVVSTGSVPVWSVKIYSEPYYNIYRNTNYLCATTSSSSSTNTNLTIQTNKDFDYARWKFTSQNGCYKITSKSLPTYSLGYSLSYNYFKNYTSDRGFYYDFYLLPLCKQDKATGAYTLQGTGWTVETFASLDLSVATSVDLRDITLPENLTAPANRNPNCLFYVKEGETKAGSLPQVVQVNAEGTDGTAESIQLTDGSDFHTTIPFTATAITYTRHLYDGWSTLALPFAYTLQGETCEAFAEATAESVRFTPVSAALEANTPYLIHRETEGDVAFRASNADVPVTASTGDCFKSNFHTFTMANSETLYKLSSDGTTFNHSSGSARIGAFRAYLDLSGTQSGGAAPKRVVHESAETPTALASAAACEATYADGVLCIRSEQADELPLYRADGTLERMLQVQVGTNYYTLARPGIYLVGGLKIVY